MLHNDALLDNKDEDTRENVDVVDVTDTQATDSFNPHDITASMVYSHKEDTTENNNGDLLKEGEEITDEQIKQLQELLEQVRQFITVTQQIWVTSQAEYGLTEDQMKELYVFNEANKISPPEDMPQAERDNWDFVNGLDKLTEEDVIRIFGEDHPIIGITHDVTKTRIKDVADDFFTYLSATKEYNDVYNGYMELLDMQQDYRIEKLRLIAKEEKDPDMRQKLLDSIDRYYCDKNIDFIREPLLANDIERINVAINREDKISYYMNRAKDKLQSMGISASIMMDIYQFEKRFLPEKYHKNNNILWVYFVQLAAYSNPADKSNVPAQKVRFMTIAFDSIVKNRAKEDTRARILENIQVFEDQFLKDKE